ncbi:response regulator [Babesia caballi]|uniref:Response regulator n=1 Tax=Babesia caballi TaxID=5871 RepID=A0AAV4LXU1_BABCB|nr:response regulator [Babesia caballi]
MGFNDVKLRNITGSTVAAILDKAFSEFTQAYSSSSYYLSYSDFLGQLEQNAATGSINHPLTSSIILTKLYCQYHKERSQETENLLIEIKETLESLRDSCALSAQDVKIQINGFIKTHITDLASSQSESEHSMAPQGSSSPAGPVAATLTTLSLGGGAAAAYLLNLGGAKTLVNGLLRIG